MRAMVLTSFGLVVSASGASAQSVCAVALESKAFDTTNTSISENVAFAKRDDLCNKTYNSLSEARGSATSAGFNLSYSGVGIGASQAKQTSDNKVKIDETDFCRATAEAFQSAYTLTYSNQIASAALAAWSNCIRTTNQNQLFMSYVVHPTGDYLAGILKTTVNTGELSRQIKGITVSGPEADNVECSILDVRLKANQTLANPYHLRATETGIACSKSGPGGASISIDTSAGSLPFIELPSKDEVAVKQKILEDQQSALQTANAQLKEKLLQVERLLASAANDLRNETTAVKNESDAKFKELVAKINGQFSLLNNLATTHSSKFSSLVDMELHNGRRGDRTDNAPLGRCDDRSFVFGVGKYEEDREAKLYFYCRSWPTLSIK